MAHWTTEHIPDQSGRIAVVTGANTGIGYETALALAQKGAHVVLACRNPERGADALARLEATHPTGTAELMILDLSSQDAVHAFATLYRAAHARLDLLINNAGVMVPPLSKTSEGLELQIGVNYFGHFALTGLLIELVNATPGSRVVTVSSLAHRQGQIDFDNFRGEKPYKPWREYSQSKLANLIFALELQRRLTQGGHAVISTAAHPGSTQTDLQRHSGFLSFFVGLWSNTPAQGALPTLYAATAPEAEPGGYYGPDGFYEAKGYPAPAKVMPQAKDEETARRLWEAGETVTGVRYL